MARTLSPAAACALAVFLGGWGAPLRAEELEMFNGFEDGSFTDGVPMGWQRVFPKAAENPGSSAEVVEGVVVFKGYAGIVTDAVFAEEVSFRTQGTFRDLEAGQTAYLVVWVHADASLEGYELALSSSGIVYLQRKGPRNSVVWSRETGPLPGFSPEDDWVLQLDATETVGGGPRLEARVWRAGDCAPAEPTLTAVDSTPNPPPGRQVLLGFWDGLYGRRAGECRFEYAWAREGASITECVVPEGLCDDFEDGDALDGRPVCWSQVPTLPAIVDVVDGRLRIRNTNVHTYGGLSLCNALTGDVSVRALTRLEVPGSGIEY